MRAFVVFFFIVFSNVAIAQPTDCNYQLVVTDKDGNKIKCDDNFCFFDTNDSILYFEIDKAYKYSWNQTIHYGIFKKGKMQHVDDFFYTIENYKNKIDINNLESGNYQLRLYYYDSNKEIKCVHNLNFQKFNDHYLPISKPKDSTVVTSTDDTLNINRTFVSKYPPTDLKRFIATLNAIATNSEQRIINSIEEQQDSLAIKRFFYNFWLSRNASNPEYAWKQYANLLNEVAKKYGTLSKKGFQTDRGRIYLKNGKPDYEVQVNAEEGTIPYEVWQYASVDNGRYTNVIFLFAQQSGNIADLKLIHCTAPVDVQNKYWENILFLPNYDATKNYRVYEFFDKK